MASSASGQLGHGNTTSTQVCTQVDAEHLEGACIVMAACGSAKSASTTSRTDSCRLVDPARFAGAAVATVACGSSHSAAVTDTAHGDFGKK